MIPLDSDFDLLRFALKLDFNLGRTPFVHLDMKARSWGCSLEDDLLGTVLHNKGAANG